MKDSQKKHFIKYVSQDRRDEFVTLKKELQLIAQQKKGYLYGLMFLYTVCAGILPLLTVWIPRYVINFITVNREEVFITRSIILFFLCLMILEIIVFVCQSRFDGDFVELRMKEMEKLQALYQEQDYWKMEDSYYQDYFMEVRRALTSPTGFEGVYRNFVKLCPCIITMLLYCFFLVKFQPIVAVICIITGMFSQKLNQKAIDYIKQKKNILAKVERQKEYFEKLSYDFTYGKEIRIFQMEKKLKKKYMEKSEEYLNILHDTANQEWKWGIGDLTFILGRNILSYLFIIYGYFNHSLTLGDVTFYIGIIVSLSALMNTLTETSKKWMESMTYAAEYFRFLEMQCKNSTYSEKNRFPSTETLKIEFRNVSFCYPNTENWVFRNLSFTIEKGEKVALVGVNGVGKSTVIKLMTGLLEPTEGNIYINDIEIREFNSTEYRAMFSAVYQEVNIYAASILENIIGDDQSDDCRKFGIHCIQAVGLKEKIELFPHKYDSQMLKIIDEDGIELSGGENQKIAIARALYKNANMVILDEPTAAQDALAETAVYLAFAQLTKNKTALYISHRLSSTIFCDKIFLMSSDGILESGNHESLMALHGEYYHMFQTQGKYYRGEQQCIN